MYENIIAGAAAANEANNKPEPGDYIKDGLLYCGKCNTPRQKEIELLPGKIFKPYIKCQCRKQQEAAAEEEQKRLDFAEMVRKYRREAFPEGKLATWTFENDDGSNEKYINAMKRYVANFDNFKEQGRGVMLYGPTGTGKTYLAACIANALIDKGYRAVFTSMSRIERTLQKSWGDRQEYIDFLSRVPLVVIDDIGTERNTSYMGEIIYSVIDARYTAGLPLIATTNLTLAELMKPAELKEQRVYGRLLEMCYPIEVKGRNKRQDKMMDTYAPIRDILGV